MQPAVARGRIDPHGCRAAANLGGVGFQNIGHRLELPAEVDQQAIAVLGIDQLIFLENVAGGWEPGHARGLSLQHAHGYRSRSSSIWRDRLFSLSTVIRS